MYKFFAYSLHSLISLFVCSRVVIFLRIITTSTMLIAVIRTPTRINKPVSGPDPKTKGIGPMKITTPVLVELLSPANAAAAKTTTTPVNTKTKPTPSNMRSHLGNPEVPDPSRLLLFCSNFSSTQTENNKSVVQQ